MAEQRRIGQMEWNEHRQEMRDFVAENWKPPISPYTAIVQPALLEERTPATVELAARERQAEADRRQRLTRIHTGDFENIVGGLVGPRYEIDRLRGIVHEVDRGCFEPGLRVLRKALGKDQIRLHADELHRSLQSLGQLHGKLLAELAQSAPEGQRRESKFSFLDAVDASSIGANNREIETKKVFLAELEELRDTIQAMKVELDSELHQVFGTSSYFDTREPRVFEYQDPTQECDDMAMRCM